MACLLGISNQQRSRQAVPFGIVPQSDFSRVGISGSFGPQASQQQITLRRGTFQTTACTKFFNGVCSEGLDHSRRLQP